MPPGSKKRKITESGGSASTHAPALRNTKELKKALESCDGSAVIQALSDSLDDTTPPETIQTLITVFRPLLEADSRPKHCVRCHESYLESANTSKSCVIKCQAPKETEYPDETSDRPWEYHMWQFPCCGRMADNDEICEDEVGDDSDDWDDPEDSDDSSRQPAVVDFGVCFTAKHTTNTMSVKYYIGRNERKQQEKGIDYSGDNKNV
ncbi:hypothetical protein FRC06_006774, partial [Ceratobasidium sp. 370]